MTGDAYERGMARLAAMWPGRSPDQATAAVYAEAIGHLDDTVWEQAVALCLRECTFYPTPGEIIQRADWLLTACGRLPPAPDDAWAQVLSVARSIAPGAIEDLSALIGAAVEGLGGIREIKLQLYRDETALVRRHFLAHYGALRQRLLRTTDVLAQPLPAQAGALPAGGRFLATR